VFVGHGAEIDWKAVNDFHQAGASKAACMEHFGFSDWDWHAAVGRGDVQPRTRGAPILAAARRAAIERMRAEGLSYTAISARLGVSKATVAYHSRRLGMPVMEKCRRRYDWRRVQEAIDEGLTVTQLTERFGFTRASYGKAVRRGAIVPRPQRAPLDAFLKVGKRHNRCHLKARLIDAGLKENRCEICGITEWMGKPLSMELHHVNGDGADNRLENLQLVCGNCHAQTDNWGGRGRSRKPAESG
jgi:DNA-binding transcriptional ArsR family regulator